MPTLKILMPGFLFSRAKLSIFVAASGLLTCPISPINAQQLPLRQELPQVPANTIQAAEQLESHEPIESDFEKALMRGPVHEAFAEQFSSDPAPTEVVDKEPPEPIDEVPPDFKPEGETIEWIPGYWGWDIETEGFVWVTGVWRNVPPDQQWIPGYWSRVEGGWQWISGFWTAAESDDLVYLPPPPESIENGPSSEAPGDNYFWVPGSWQLNQQEYHWQAGTWALAQDNWVWVPNRYIWTPSGCIYRDGYWDHELESRGTIFCPVTFQTGYHQQFRPRYVVEVGPLWLANLFVVQGYNHYCFGNYHGYRGNRTIYPWVDYYQRSHRHDHMYGYYAYQSRNTNLIRQIARVERQIQSNPALRTQLTVAEHLRAYKNLSGPQTSWAIRAVPLNKLATNGAVDFDTPFRFTAFEPSSTPAEKSDGRSSRQLASQRRQLEQPKNDADKRRAQSTSTKQAKGKDANNRNDTGDGIAGNVTNSPNDEKVKRIKLREPSEPDSTGRSERSKPAKPSEAPSTRPTPPNNAGASSNPAPAKPRTQRDAGTKQSAIEQNKQRGDVVPGNDPKAKSENLGATDPRQSLPGSTRDRDPKDATGRSNPLDNLYQGLNDQQSGAEDARQLRDMMRRNSRPSSDAKKGSTPDPKGFNSGRSPEPGMGEKNPPGSRLPGANLPGVNPPRANPPAVNPPAVNPPAVNPPRANPPAANPPRANPPAANPPRSDAKPNRPPEAGKDSKAKARKENNKPSKPKNGKND